MAETRIDSAVASDLGSALSDFIVPAVSTDGATGVGDTRWHMTDWEENLGYYLEIPELQVAIDTEATWTVGGGFEADPATTLLISMITGNGKDSFNSILGNCVRVATIGGDSFAEVMRGKEGILVNLKPLDPSSMVIVQNNKGRIKGYEQVTKGKVPKKFEPEQIFHLSRKRIADSIHGISVIPAVKKIILARNEAMNDWQRVLHMNIDPRWQISLDTDDDTEITAYKTKYDKANAKGENMYIPKGTVEVDVLGVAPNATLNPLAWIDKLNDYFFQTVNVPQIIVGNAKEFTDASGKIVYLSYEQSVKGKQLYVEEQVLDQLNLQIELTFPASMQNEMISDEAKQPDLVAGQPSDTTAELEGKE